MHHRQPSSLPGRCRFLWRSDAYLWSQSVFLDAETQNLCKRSAQLWDSYFAKERYDVGFQFYEEVPSRYSLPARHKVDKL